MDSKADAGDSSEEVARDTSELQATSAGLPSAISTRAPAATLVMMGLCSHAARQELGVQMAGVRNGCQWHLGDGGE